MRWLSALALMVIMVVASGCSGDAAPSGQPTAPAGDGVPDACSLITSDRLSELLGSPQGAGTSSGAGSQRSVCIYSSGTITAVEVASHYDASKQIIIDDGRTATDVPGVGKAAFFDSAGQLVAKGDRVFVAVTAIGVPTNTLATIAREMLTAAGDTA